MKQELFNRIFQCLKILKEKSVTFPQQGEQSQYRAYNPANTKEEFGLIINRKAHINPEYLTYQLISKYGIVVRLDMNGAPHENYDGTTIDTPHLHIFDEEHDNGRLAIPLSEVTDIELLTELSDSLLEFMRYNNIDSTNISVGMF